jgi:iron(III)-salmochelin esterase
MLTRRALLAGLATTALSCRGERSDPAPAPATSGARVHAPPPLVAKPPAIVAAVPPSAAAKAAVPATVVSAAPPSRGADLDVHGIAFGPSQGGPQEAVLLVPSWGEPGERFPLLVALDGRGETARGMDAGAWGWVKDYWLDRAMRRLRTPPLTSPDFQDYVEPARLDAITASLLERPFRGLVVACPYTPDLLPAKTLDNAGPFGHFVTDLLLARVRAEAPVRRERTAVGIDGVSLGGRLAPLVGVEHPETFGAVGVMQGAFELEEVDELVKRVAVARRRAAFRLRVLTSEKDFYKEAMDALHAALDQASVPHDYLSLPGTHDYRFNRGPASFEMLLWHDRVLRGEAP